MSLTIREEQILVEAYKNRGWLPFNLERTIRRGLLGKGLFAWDHQECYYLLTPEGWEAARCLAEKEARR